MSGRGGVSTKVKPLESKLDSPSVSVWSERFTTPENHLAAILSVLELLTFKDEHKCGKKSKDTFKSAAQKSRSRNQCESSGWVRSALNAGPRSRSLFTVSLLREFSRSSLVSYSLWLLATLGRAPWGLGLLFLSSPGLVVIGRLSVGDRAWSLWCLLSGVGSGVLGRAPGCAEYTLSWAIRGGYQWWDLVQSLSWVGMSNFGHVRIGHRCSLGQSVPRRGLSGFRLWGRLIVSGRGVLCNMAQVNDVPRY